MAETTLITRLRNGWAQSTSEASVGRLPRPVLLGVLCVALGVWVSAHWSLPWKLWSGDACEYAEMGRRLAAGNGFTTGVIFPAELHLGSGTDKPAVLRPPAWPVALAAFFLVAGPTEIAAHAATGAFYIGTVALTAALGSALAGPLVGAIAAVALATTPAFLGLALDTISETPFAFLVTLAFLLFVRRGPAFAIGLVCGAAYLTRYNGLILFPVFAGLVWLRRPRAFRAVLHCAAGFAIVAAPWWIRNAVVTGDPFFTLLNLNLYLSPQLTNTHDSLLYMLQPDFDSKIAMHPLEKLLRQLPELITTWPLASLNLLACIGLAIGCVRGDRASLGLLAIAVGTTFAAALGLPQGRYFVPLLPACIALGASAWSRSRPPLAAAAFALIVITPWFLEFPRQSDDLAMLRGFFETERAANRTDPKRAVQEDARFDALRRCLPGQPLVLAQGAPRLVWETGAIAIYAPNHPNDFFKIVAEQPVEFAQMRHWRRIDRNRFAREFSAIDGCEADLYRLRAHTPTAVDAGP
jgi:4-amino-4-deoxy-L-arabinose transferase-like glycosyltransferase